MEHFKSVTYETSQVGACGNATRCIGGLIFEEDPSLSVVNIRTKAVRVPTILQFLCAHIAAPTSLSGNRWTVSPPASAGPAQVLPRHRRGRDHGRHGRPPPPLERGTPRVLSTAEGRVLSAASPPQQLSPRSSARSRACGQQSERWCRQGVGVGVWRG